MYSSYPTGVYRRAHLLIRGRFHPLMAKGFSRSLSFFQTHRENVRTPFHPIRR